MNAEKIREKELEFFKWCQKYFKPDLADTKFLQVFRLLAEAFEEPEPKARLRGEKALKWWGKYTGEWKEGNFVEAVDIHLLLQKLIEENSEPVKPEPEICPECKGEGKKFVCLKWDIVPCDCKEPEPEQIEVGDEVEFIVRGKIVDKGDQDWIVSCSDGQLRSLDRSFPVKLIRKKNG